MSETADASQPSRLTREELHELVWSEPMRTLAPRYGLSDAGLAKVCRRHKVPRPWRGYWQQKAAGKRVRPARLRPLKPDEENQLGTIVLRPSDDRKPTEDETGPVAEQKKYEAEHPIAVPEYIVRLHTLVREIQKHCRASQEDSPSFFARRHLRHAAVDVGPDSLPRALRIMDVLVRALEQRSFPVALELEKEDSPARVLVTVRDASIAIRLEERRTQVEIPPSPADAALSRRFSWSARPRKELRYTGKFALKIEESWAEGVRKTWADGKTQRVEGCLNAFMVGLVRAAEAKKRAKAEWEERQRRREEERERRIEEELRRREEALRGERLEREAAAWAKAEAIRAYISAVRERAERQGSIEPDSELARWLEWAEDYAKALDPLGRSLPGGSSSSSDAQPE